MRVTESRLMDLAGAGVSRARSQAARAAEELSSGERVTRSSDDPVAWAEGMRASARHAQSDGRGLAIARARERLVESDAALGGIGDALARARELAVQLGNDHFSAAERAGAADEMRALRAQILAHASARGSDGEYLFAGGAGGTAPFDPTTGAYLGDAARRSVEVGEGGQLAVATVSGEVLTTAAGVDVLPVLDTLIAALDGNDAAGVRASLTDLVTATEQVAAARTDVGARMATLDRADEARQDFELRLAESHEHAVGADPVDAASRFADAQSALAAARAAAEALIQMARGNRP
jgi:flagellar hook-associated protein 3 FlgL